MVPPISPTCPTGARFDDGAGGDNEVQRTMLELINQLDGFDPRGGLHGMQNSDILLYHDSSILGIPVILRYDFSNFS